MGQSKLDIGAVGAGAVANMGIGAGAVLKRLDRAAVPPSPFCGSTGTEPSLLEEANEETLGTILGIVLGDGAAIPEL
jgi:hypothetical protein